MDRPDTSARAVYPTHVETLAPDLPAPLDGQTLSEGRDPALEAIAAAQLRR